MAGCTSKRTKLDWGLSASKDGPDWETPAYLQYPNRAQKAYQNVLEEILSVLYRPITNKLEEVMSEIENTRDKVEALSGQIDQMQQRVVEDVNALKDKLAQRDIDEAVLEEINSGLDSITQRVKAIDPDPSNPPTDTPPVDTPPTGEPEVDPARASWKPGRP